MNKAVADGFPCWIATCGIFFRVKLAKCVSGASGRRLVSRRHKLKLQKGLWSAE